MKTTPYPIEPGHAKLFADALSLAAQKVVEDEPTLGVLFPHVTAPDGSWVKLPASLSAGYHGSAWSHGNWNCGFWVGLLLASYLHTGQERFLTWARERMRLVAQRADDPNTHDIGFIFDSSAIPAYHITGDRWYADIALDAAQRLRARTVTTRSGAYLSAWGPLTDPRGRASSAIDTMNNLPLLYWAADHSGDASYRLAAQAHAEMTARAFVRADDSTYHAVEYDISSGQRLRGFTFQGHADESFWSRGQTWAIYGYLHTAKATGRLDWLALAERLANRYLQRLGDRVVPPYDFDAPAGCPQDSAAAAIVSSALLELARVHPDRSAGERWHALATSMLAGLCRDYLARDSAHRGLLMHSCYSEPHGEGVDGATMFGDFYFVEALCRAVHPGRLRPLTEVTLA